KNDEAILWQGAIEPRMEGFREKLQYELLDRFEMGLQLVIETPAFDDQTPLFDAVQKSATVPLTNDDRRAILGLDPFDETIYGKLGAQVLISHLMVPIFDPTTASSAPAAAPRVPGAPSPI